MLINDESQKQVLAVLAKTAITPSVEAQQRASTLLQLNPGQQVKAEIIANLPNSLYLARVAGEMYKLEIPLNVQPGETLEMTFVTSDPRVTFQVLRPELGESVKLSSMGKWLADVAKNAPALPVQQPLLEHPEQSTHQLAAGLKSALTQTGLFYEAHLAQWAGGALSLKELLREPQGKLSRIVKEGEGEGEGGEGVMDAAGFADGRTLPLIREQLLLLNSGVLAWQGAAWPGQDMKLAIKEGDRDPSEPAIEATLSLDLPRLGGVEARLVFGADGLELEFICTEPGSAELLKGKSGELRGALGSCGVQLTRMAAKDG